MLLWPWSNTPSTKLHLVRALKSALLLAPFRFEIPLRFIMSKNKITTIMLIAQRLLMEFISRAVLQTPQRCPNKLPCPFIFLAHKNIEFTRIKCGTHTRGRKPAALTKALSSKIFFGCSPLPMPFLCYQKVLWPHSMVEMNIQHITWVWESSQD